MQNAFSFTPLGGVGDVTKNMYLYEYGNEILIVDCGLGFADETMLGVDLLLPDISSLLKAVQSGKRIVGMLITHGHEDHMGGLPFMLPQLPDFPIFATPLTAALANEKLQELQITRKLQPVAFEENKEVKLGNFSAQFIRVTHSVPDTSHIFIKTPVGNFYHGSDYKFDLTPADGKKTDFQKIVELSKQGVTCLFTDCLGSERAGYTPSEAELTKNFASEMRDCKGKFIVTTYSSNISRLNQAMEVAFSMHRKVCFVGRSLVKTTDVAKRLGLMKIPKGMEIRMDQVKNTKPQEIMLVVAGSQGQENSALTRIANTIHRDITISSSDVIVFSSDPIPGNEVNVNTLIDTLSKIGAKVVYSDISDKFHVSGQGSSQDIMLLMELVRPQNVLPISVTYKDMVAYKKLAQKQGFSDSNIFLIEDGQPVLFEKNSIRLGQKFPVRNIYVDEYSGEEIDKYVLVDRQKISQEGVVVIMTEIDSENGTLMGSPDIIARGFANQDIEGVGKLLPQAIKTVLEQNKSTSKNWNFVRKIISQTADKVIQDKLHLRPLVLPIVIEV